MLHLSGLVIALSGVNVALQPDGDCFRLDLFPWCILVGWGFISGVYSNRTKGVQMCSDHFPNPEPLTLSVTLSQTATRTTRWGVRRDWFAVGTTAPSSIRFPQPPASPDHRTVARVSVDAELPGCRVPFARIDKGCTHKCCEGKRC